MFNFDVITSQILVGSAPFETTNIDVLAAAGVGAVLNLQTDSDLAYHDIDWQMLARHYRARGITVIRHPVADFDQRALRDGLPGCVRDLRNLLAAGHIVYVHCNMGINRSTTTVIAYLHWEAGMTVEQATALVMSRRDCQPWVAVIGDASW